MNSPIVGLWPAYCLVRLTLHWSLKGIDSRTNKLTENLTYPDRQTAGLTDLIVEDKQIDRQTDRLTDYSNFDIDNS